MEELNLNYRVSQKQRLIYTILSSYFTIIGLYLVIQKVMIKTYDLTFWGVVILSVLAIFMLLANTVWTPGSILIINNENIKANIPDNKKVSIEWVAVSSVNIGPGYILFLINGGQKQQKLELTALKYNDVMKVKSKVIELCEHKNIPYHND